MKVAFDVSPLAQTGAGTARVIHGLTGALEGRPELEILPVDFDFDFDFDGHGRAATVARDLAWYPFGIAREARSADVLHCTTMRGPLRAHLPVVITVHDCALLRHPGAFPPWHRHTGRVALRHGVKSADAIVAVSAFTRDELIELLDVPAERIHVVPNGLEPIFTEAGPKAAGDYVLAVGTLEPRKNLANAVEAAKRAGVELRVVGAPGWGGVAVPGWAGRVDDEELAALYRGARCLVFPSLYEGFGLPVIEAMACGTPVVTSRGGATEEVAGGAAVLVDALDLDAIAAGIAEAEARHDELRRLGLERAGAFTWSHAADLVEALWRELA
jgi:glycosyltransferase involved in cell wall biosynthesis